MISTQNKTILSAILDVNLAACKLKGSGFEPKHVN